MDGRGEGGQTGGDSKCRHTPWISRIFLLLCINVDKSEPFKINPDSPNLGNCTSHNYPFVLFLDWTISERTARPSSAAGSLSRTSTTWTRSTRRFSAICWTRSTTTSCLKTTSPTSISRTTPSSWKSTTLTSKDEKTGQQLCVRSKDVKARQVHKQQQLWRPRLLQTQNDSELIEKTLKTKKLDSFRVKFSLEKRCSLLSKNTILFSARLKMFCDVRIGCFGIKL